MVALVVLGQSDETHLVSSYPWFQQALVDDFTNPHPHEPGGADRDLAASCGQLEWQDVRHAVREAHPGPHVQLGQREEPSRAGCEASVAAVAEIALRAVAVLSPFREVGRMASGAFHGGLAGCLQLLDEQVHQAVPRVLGLPVFGDHE